MQIKELCKICHLTKKAVYYYEQQGFLRPAVMENGYRNYGEKEVAILKEIAILRKCGLGINDIRTILESGDKASTLLKCKHLRELKLRQYTQEQQYLDELINGYDVNRAFDEIQKTDLSAYTVQEKLTLAFPGSYGIYLSLHFGRFLNEPIHSNEQRSAYEKIVEYLDDVRLSIPDELGKYLEDVFSFFTSVSIEKMEADIHAAIENAIQNPDAVLDNENTSAYIEYRLSDEYKSSPAGRLTALMVEFQNSTGYQENFIENLKILSPTYKKYCEEVMKANDLFLENHPETKQFFDFGG